MTTAVKVWISVLLASLTAYGGYSIWRQVDRSRAVASAEDKAEIARPTGSLADSKLTDSNDRHFSLDSLKGDVWLASFFFTTCPGPCAQMNRSIAGLQKEFPNKDLKFVSITCDPDNDTPKVLAAYAKTFQAEPKRWIFLTGSLATVQHLGEDVFKIAVRQKEHSQRVLLVDRTMKVRGMYLLDDQAQLIALRRKLKSLLDNTAPAAEEDAIETPPSSATSEHATEAAATDAAKTDEAPDVERSGDKPAGDESTEEKPTEEKPADETAPAETKPSEESQAASATEETKP